MSPAQHGMTEDPAEDIDQEEPQQDSPDRGFLRFLRRRDNGTARRSETEWEDTLVAQEEAEPEPISESPFQAGAPAEPEPLPEPEPVADEYVTERRWRRRSQDPLDEIHNYIDRVIGSDRDPLVRHRKLAGLGVARHAAPRRDLASVAVEGLDKELMIAFTFPKEELRSARVVYETEGGYVIEVARAIAGDDNQLERQHYTVSRVGSVAHVLDKLRAREIEREVQRGHRTETTTTTTVTRETRTIEPHEAETMAAEEPETPVAETPTPSEPASQWERGSETAGPETTNEPTASPETPSVVQESEKTGKPGFLSFMRRKESQEEAAPAQEGDAPGTETTEAQAPADDAEKKGRFGGLTARFRRKEKGEDEPAPDEPQQNA